MTAPPGFRSRRSARTLGVSAACVFARASTDEDQLGELLWAFQWCEVPGVERGVQRNVGEVMLEAVGPLAREQRIMLWPQHIGGHMNLDGSIGRKFGEGLGGHSRAGTVPGDRRAERSRKGVIGHQPVQIIFGDSEIRSGPVNPKVP